MKLLSSKWFWAFAFGALFVLSIDLWAWDWTEPSLLGLPYIIVYVAVLETILFALFFLFAKYYWIDSAEGSE